MFYRYRCYKYLTIQCSPSFHRRFQASPPRSPQRTAAGASSPRSSAAARCARCCRACGSRGNDAAARPGNRGRPEKGTGGVLSRRPKKREVHFSKDVDLCGFIYGTYAENEMNLKIFLGRFYDLRRIMHVFWGVED